MKFDIPEKLDTSFRFYAHPGFSQVTSLVHGWIVQRNRNVITGTRKVDEARHEGEIRGVDRGVAKGLAAMANELRNQAYLRVGDVPMVSEYDMLRLMHQWIDAWNTLVGKEAAARDKDERDQRRKRETEWLNAVKAAHTAFALHPKLEEIEQERHRKAVLAKEEKPTEADREWIAELIRTEEKKQDDLRSLLS